SWSAMLNAPQAHDVLLMLCVVIRKNVAAGAIGNEIELLGACRICGSLERSSAGISDRPWRQTIDDISVIGCRLFNLAPQDRATQRTFTACQPVDDCRIRLKAHSAPKAIDKDGSNPRALVRSAGFLLHDRGKRDQLIRRL